MMDYTLELNNILDYTYATFNVNRSALCYVLEQDTLSSALNSFLSI